MNCLGRTKSLKRCRQPLNLPRFFCHHHRWQPLAWLLSLLTLVGLAAGIYQDLWRPAANAFFPPSQPDESNPHAQRDLWWGKWLREDRPWSSSQIEIRETTTNGFRFYIEAISGSHTGTLDGIATFTNPNEAVFKSNPWEDLNCHITMSKDHGPLLTMQVSSANTSHYHGLSVSFNGLYYKHYDPLAEKTAFNDFELTTIYDALGEHYEPLIRCLQRTNTNQEHNNPERYKSISGFAVGMATDIAAIVVVGRSEHFWAAYINEHSDSINFFTNHFRGAEHPTLVNTWLDSHKGKPIIEHYID